MSKSDDDPMFDDKDKNGYMIQICRESITISGKLGELPEKKSEVLNDLLEEPEAYLFNHVSKKHKSPPDDGEKEPSSDNVIQKKFTKETEG